MKKWLLLICILLKISQEIFAEKPNFLFILVDDLGWADVSCYGSAFYETPNIDKLANEGMRFTNAYAACPVCSPSRASILTGKYPARLNLTDWIPGSQSSASKAKYMKVIPPEFEQQMPLEELTIAEALEKGGYRTGFFGKWHLGKEEFYPEYQGFEINKGGWEKGAPYYRGYDKNQDLWHGESGYFSPYKNPRLSDGQEGEYLTDRLTNEVIDFLKQKNEKPFFAYLSFYTVHNPLHAKAEKVEKYKNKAKQLEIDSVYPFINNKEWMNRPDPGIWQERIIQSNAEYAAMIESMDENVGRVLKAIKDLGLEDNTIIIFTSDNGGLSTSEGSPTTNNPLRAGKGWLYEGGIREPLLVKWPGKTSPNSICHTPVIGTDFYPTIMDMAELDLIPEQHADGINITALLTNTNHSENRPLFWHYPHYSNQGGLPGAAIRLGDYKLIEFFEDQRIELYNLSTDIGETKDLSNVMPDKVNELSDKLHNWQKEAGAKFPKQKSNTKITGEE